MKRLAWVLLLLVLNSLYYTASTGCLLDLKLDISCKNLDDAVVYLPLTGSLNDAAGNVTSAVFARSSSTTRVNPDTGYIETVAADTPAFERYGLQFIGTSVTNYVTYSEDFSQWGNFNQPIIALVSGQGSPDNSTNAYKVTEEENTSSYRYIHHTLSLVSDGVYTACLFIKPTDDTEAGDKLTFGLYDFTVIAFTARATIELQSDGTLALSTPAYYGLDRGIEEIGNGWWLLWVVSNDSITAANDNRLLIYPAGAGTAPTHDTSWYIFGAGCYNTRFAPPYIKTSGSTASRAADSLYFVLPDSVADIFVGDGTTHDSDGESEGVMMATMTPMVSQDAGTTGAVCRILTSGWSGQLYASIGSTALWKINSYDGVNLAGKYALSLTRNQTAKWVANFSKTGNYLNAGSKIDGVWRWGVSTPYDGGFTINNDPARLNIGINAASGIGGFWLKNIRIYNKYMTTTEIESKY